MIHIHSVLSWYIFKGIKNKKLVYFIDGTKLLSLEKHKIMYLLNSLKVSLSP